MIMSNFRENFPNVHGTTTQQSSEDEMSHFRRRILGDKRCLCPRRYVMALLLSAVLVIEVARHWNFTYTLHYTVFYTNESEKMKYPSIGNWTLDEFETFHRFAITGGIVTNILGGLLIYKFSSHTFLLVTVTASSILHALLPTALNHHSTAFLLIVMIGQETLSAPIFVAVLSMWKDWAPPDERTRLVSISFLGIAVEAVGTILTFAFYTKDFKSISYFVGVAGTIWALFWYNTASSTPQSDPLITEKEYLYLESKIPSNYQEKTSLRDVPWKSMFSTKQFVIICLIFFKLGSSVEAIQISEVLLFMYVRDTTNPLLLFIPFMVFYIFIFYGSSFLMDFVLQKYRTKALMIRKCFLCSGFVLESAILLGSLIPSSFTIRAILFSIAYCCFAFSIPGVLRYPLDLSPRYVSIISGMAFGSYCLGTLCLQEIPYLFIQEDSSRPEAPWFIYDIVVSLLAAVVFGLWGDVEEQSWSFLSSSQRRGNDYRSYPQPDDEDDAILVSGTV